MCAAKNTTPRRAARSKTLTAKAKINKLLYSVRAHTHTYTRRHGDIYFFIWMGADEGFLPYDVPTP